MFTGTYGVNTSQANVLISINKIANINFTLSKVAG
jgi:hypothetical protein